MWPRKRRWITACYHPFCVGVVALLFIVYKFFPSVFALLVNSSPVIVCTSLLLGILLGFVRSNVSENEEDDDLIDASSSLENESVANDLVAKNEEKFKVGSCGGSKRATKRMTVKTIVLGGSKLNEPDQADATSVYPVEEDNNLIEDKHAARRLAEDLIEASEGIGCAEKITTVLGASADETKLERCHDSCSDSSWNHINHKDASSDSEYDGTDISNSSVANAVPILDELDPLVTKDNSEDDSVAFSESHVSDDGSTEDEAENQDDEDDEEAQEEKDDGNKVVVTWTADDQKNLMDLGKSELERNRWLENLIAKREAKKATEKNLIDLDDNIEETSQAYAQLPSISAPRRNPFDLPYDSDESIPGSAPSVLLPRRNPFDLSYEQIYDEGNSNQELVAVPQRDMFIRRHESFSVGASFFSDFKVEKRASRFKAYFGAEKNEPQETAYAGLHRESSGSSDSKLSSTSESDAVSSVIDQEHQKDLLLGSGSSTTHETIPIEQNSQSLEDVKSADVQQVESQMNIINDHTTHSSDSVLMEQTHQANEIFGTANDDTSRDLVLNLADSFAERAEVIDEEYESSSSTPSEAEKNTPDLEQMSDGPSKGSTASSKTIVADSDVVNVETDHVHDSHIVEPVYDSSPTATERSHSNSAHDEAFCIAGKKLFVELLCHYKGGSPSSATAERTISSGGGTEESLTSTQGTLWVVPLSLAFVDQNESVSREISIIKELDVIGDELSKVHEDFGGPILPVLPDPAARQSMLGSNLSSVEIQPNRVFDCFYMPSVDLFGRKFCDFTNLLDFRHLVLMYFELQKSFNCEGFIKVRGKNLSVWRTNSIKMQPKARVYADPSLDLDEFERLPDSIVLLIFNKVADVRSLGRCSAVSKRFNSLVYLVNDVYLKIDHVVTIDGDCDDPLSPSSPRHRRVFSNFVKLILSTLLKPFHNLRSTNGGNKAIVPQLSHHSPAQVLKNFAHVRNLRIELPAGEVATEEGVLLKWRAEFGSTIQNCVIFGGTRVDRKPVFSEHESPVEDSGSIPDSFYTNGGLKLRVVWTINSLIAASTRHYLLQPIIKDHPTLKSLVLADADGQGTLNMGVEQLKEFREKPLIASAASSRTQVPASNMKLKYSPYLDLPGGMALQGATLVTIKPSSDGSSGTNTNTTESDTFIFGAFEGPFKAAAKSLMKRRTYLLEMNGF
ncbi:hypothetical protein BHE74_00021401 [Ensete ventricosum]|nr:hypothetical protein BHE74_00021401 [Ensete ventricosum]